MVKLKVNRITSETPFRELEDRFRMQRFRFLLRQPEYQAYRIMHLGYSIVPLVIGVDKFFNRLTDWNQFVSPGLPKRLGVKTHQIVKSVGALEILAGIGTLLAPRIFGPAVSAWFLGSATNMAMRKGRRDTALRDVGLSLGALALGRLGKRYPFSRV